MADTPTAAALVRNATIRAELEAWIDGRIIAQKEIDRFGTVVAVVARDDGQTTFYDVVRAFALGDGAGVSMDMQDGTLEGLANCLLGMTSRESV